MFRDRSNPRMSITKFAEYVTASPRRRRSILRDQRFPPAFKAATFREAYAAIADVLIRGGTPDLVEAQLGIWRKRKPNTEFTARCLALCIDALTAFRALLAKRAFEGFSFVLGLSEAYVDLGGVRLSARPEALVRGPEVGASKSTCRRRCRSPRIPRASRARQATPRQPCIFGRRPNSAARMPNAAWLSMCSPASSTPPRFATSLGVRIWKPPVRRSRPDGRRSRHRRPGRERAPEGRHDPEALAGWTLEAVRELLARGIFEDRRLEFKEMLPNGKDKNKDGRRRCAEPSRRSRTAMAASW
jgi:hypothetical protein